MWRAKRAIPPEVVELGKRRLGARAVAYAAVLRSFLRQARRVVGGLLTRSSASRAPLAPSGAARVRVRGRGTRRAAFLTSWARGRFQVNLD